MMERILIVTNVLYVFMAPCLQGSSRAETKQATEAAPMLPAFDAHVIDMPRIILASNSNPKLPIHKPGICGRILGRCCRRKVAYTQATSFTNLTSYRLDIILNNVLLNDTNKRAIPLEKICHTISVQPGQKFIVPAEHFIELPDDTLVQTFPLQASSFNVIIPEPIFQGIMANRSKIGSDAAGIICSFLDPSGCKKSKLPELPTWRTRKGTICLPTQDLALGMNYTIAAQ